jgi:predicted ATPase
VQREPIGRSNEIAAVVASLRKGGELLTLTGPPGVGKTAIASAAARSRERDGTRVLFVSFAGISSDQDADTLMAQRVGELVSPGSSPATTTDAFGVPSWVRSLEAAPLAPLVLDGCEANLPLASRVSELFLEASDGSVLVTTRERLGLPMEKVLVVHPLACPLVDAGA